MKGWRPQIDALAGDYTLLWFDNRGVGKSRMENTPLTIESMAADAAAVLDAERIDRCHVVGHSMGGLIAQELAAFSACSRLVIQGPVLALRPEAAQAVALVLHELATNALKYGALTSERGRIHVGWSVSEENGARRLGLEWQEDTALDRQSTKKEGFGKELLTRTLRYELNADTKFTLTRNGLRYSLSLPLPPDGQT